MDSMGYRYRRGGRGFTITELLIVISVIAILAAVSIVMYTGMQRRAAENSIMNDLEHASSLVEKYALDNGGNFPDDEHLRTILQSSPDVHISITVEQPAPSGGGSVPRYINLSPIQNSVLFHKICNELTEEYRPDAPDLRYGQGRNAHGQVTTFINGPSFCNVYNATDIQMTTSWSALGGRFNAPVTLETVQSKANGITNSDSHFPDLVHVGQQYYNTLSDRFLASGGTYPITTFWNPWCNGGCTNAPREALPEPVLISEGAAHTEETYCILATHSKHPELSFSFSSDALRSQRGNCSNSEA